MSAPDLSGLSQPGQQAPAKSAPAGGGHARLLSMIQGLALGVDAFATSAATQGREGGMPEVQQVRAQQQQQQIQAQENQRAQQESDLRMKTMNANLLMQQAAYHHALQMYPTEEKGAALDVLNKATASYKDALAEGYDLQDPGQAALWRNMQQNIINIPFSGGQNQQEVLASATDAAQKAGKNITDFVPLVDYKDAQHGTGGTLTLVPAAGLQQVQATPKQIAAGIAQMKGTLDTATAALGKDDPDVKTLSGKLGTIQKVLDSGGKPSAYDFLQLNSSIIGPLSTRIGAATQREKIQQQQADTAKAQQQAKNEKPENAVKLAGDKAAAEAKARQPYDVALKKMEAPIAAGVASDKEAREKVDTYSKAYVDKLQGANELLSSLDQAEAGNSAASKAAIFKMAGMALPSGGKRGFAEAVGALEKQGNVPQQWISKIKDAVTGDKWTSEMSQDMRDFAKAQADVAAETLRSQVRIMNVNHKTQVDPEALINAAGHLSSVSPAPAGSLAEKWGKALTKSVSPGAIQ